MTKLIQPLLFIFFQFITVCFSEEYGFFVNLPDSLNIDAVHITLRWNGKETKIQHNNFYDNEPLVSMGNNLWKCTLRLPGSGKISYFYSIKFRKISKLFISERYEANLPAKSRIQSSLEKKKLISTENYTPRDRPPYLSFQNDPSSTMTINWETAIPGNSQIEYGETSSYGNILIDSQHSSFHSLEITGLVPNTVYHYRVITENVYTSEDHTFRTAPDQQNQPFTFVALGDSRSNDQIRQKVVKVVENVNPDFVVFTGDLVDDGTKQPLWDTWFSSYSRLMNTTPLLSAIGNHEKNSDLYYQLFYFPVHSLIENIDIDSPAESYYSFDYGSVHFIVLNSGEIGGPGHFQYDWLENDLQQAVSNPNILWKIAVFHHPAYSSGNHGSEPGIQQYWVPLLEQYGVDIVLNGHDHNYERTNPINNLIYVVTGGAGAPIRSVGSSNWTAYSRSIYHFCKFQINGTNLYFEAIDTTGSVFDSFNISITPSQLKYIDYGIKKFQLMQNYPNPFNGSTVFTYQLAEPANVFEISIFDLLGKKIWQHREMNKPAGTYSVSWNGLTNTGQELPTGIYLYEAHTEQYRDRKKLMIVR